MICIWYEYCKDEELRGSGFIGSLELHVAGGGSRAQVEQRRVFQQSPLGGRQTKGGN